MQIVLLCGGLGTRLSSIDSENPKSMKLINNKPFLFYLLNSLNNFSFSSIHFCLGFKSEKIISYIKKIHTNQNFTFSIENEDNLLGTGGAIKNSLEYLEDNFIIQYGDTILRLNYHDLLELHLISKKKMTMSIINSKLSNEIPNIYCEDINKNQRKCIYSKENPRSDANFIDYGAMVFKKSVFKNHQETNFPLSKIQENLTINDESAFFEAYHPYTEIGSPISFEKAKTRLNDF